jgi:autotransporter-associated beta strand protein
VVFDAAKNFTLGGSGALSGGVSLSKYGSGTLTVGTTNSSFAGTIDLAGGALTLSPGSSIGTGALTLRGGAFLNLATSGTIFPANPLNIPADESGTITSGSLGNALLGAVTGDSSSVLNIGGSVSFGQASPQFTGFPGTVRIPAGNTLRFSGTSGSNGGVNTAFEVNGTLLLRNQGTSAQLGALTGSGLLSGEKPTGGTLTFIVGAKNLDGTFTGLIADKNGPATNTALTKVGSGALTLTGNSSHSGPTTVNAGRLVVNGTWANSRVTVAGGATLAGTGVLGGGVGLLAGGGIAPGAAPGAAGTLTIGNGFGPTNATLYFDLSASPAGANDRIVMNGGKLAMSGTQTYVFNLTDGTLGNGSYDLITGATDSSAWSSAVHNLPSGTRQTFSLVRPAAGSNPSYTQLDVTGNAASLVWDGSAGGTWDLTNSDNWLSAGVPETFYNLDLVRFDDSAADGNVTLAGTLYPGAITVSNATRSFTLGGEGALTGAGTLTKSGPGTLTLNTTNTTFTGAVNLASGTTSLGNAAGLGSGTVTLSGGAVLNLAGSLSYPGNPINVPAGQSGTVTSSGGLGNGLSGLLTGATSSVLNLGNGVSFSGTTSAQVDGFAGTIQIQTGATLRFSSGSSGNTYGSLVPTFVINGTLQPRNAGNTIQLGALAGTGTIAGPQSNAGAGSTTYVIGGNDSDATFDGVISSNSAVAGSLVELSKVGNGTLTLNGASTYTGGTTVNAGTLRVNNVTGSGTGGGPLSIESGATLTGSGSIGSPTTLDEGATLAPGDPVGTLTFGDALALNEAAILQFELGTARDQVVVNGALTLAGTLNVTAVNGFGAGTYMLFSYRPEVGLSLGAVTLGNVPGGYQYLLSTNTPGQVDLIVSLPTPPGFGVPMISGGDLIFSGAGGTPGADYYVLTTTNLAGVWTPLATNQFDDSGNFSFTNTMNPGAAQQFFRLLVP